MGLDIKSLFSGGIASILDSSKAIISQFVADPIEKAKAIQDLENEANRHQEAVLTAANELELAALKDTDSARNREIQIATSDKAPLITKIIQPLLASGTVVLTFILFYMVLFKTMGTEKDVIIYILGALTAITGQIFSFYFGSSSGSESKQKHIESLLK